MTEIDYLDVANHTRIKTALRLIGYTMFLDESEEDLQQEAIKALAQLDLKLNRRIRLKDAK